MKDNGVRKALFLDRDGTINIEKNYVYKIEDFEFQPGIFDLISDYQKIDFLVFIVTNQSGIARGLYTEENYQTLTRWMTSRFEQEGITIAKVYHCPHHPEITGECYCRKPNPGMILQAIGEYKIDRVNSVLIGDKKSDILAGKKAGIGKNIYIQELLGKYYI
jgi:D-glycero-D-manno-heptose 1,7-bisphosphate phosphatase